MKHLTTLSKNGEIIPNCKNCELQRNCTISDCRDEMMLSLHCFEQIFKEGYSLWKLYDLVGEIEETLPELIYNWKD